jgi:hypothetical protein
MLRLYNLVSTGKLKSYYRHKCAIFPILPELIRILKYIRWTSSCFSQKFLLFMHMLCEWGVGGWRRSWSGVKWRNNDPIISSAHYVKKENMSTTDSVIAFISCSQKCSCVKKQTSRNVVVNYVASSANCLVPASQWKCRGSWIQE